MFNYYTIHIFYLEKYLTFLSTIIIVYKSKNDLLRNIITCNIQILLISNYINLNWFISAFILNLNVDIKVSTNKRKLETSRRASN